MGRICCPKCCEGYHEELDRCPRCGPLDTAKAAYEARIAELEALVGDIDKIADRCEFQAEQINELVAERDATRAELRRVKAESLRVVECGSENIQPDRYVRHIFLGCNPVRLERWATEE